MTVSQILTEPWLHDLVPPARRERVEGVAAGRA
jgi:hypothetical protein